MKLYEVFYNFIINWFPMEIIEQYNDIFVFATVVLVLALILGFIFFIMRTIRRLTGFKG